MRSLKRSVERNRRKLVKKAEVALLATMMASASFPAFPVYAYGVEPLMYTESSVIPNDVEEIDISKGAISNGIIEIKLDKNGGAYKLTGTNYDKNNACYVDVKIYVPDRTTVDIYLDGLAICNDDSMNDDAYTTTSGDLKNVSPIVINGTANVHVMSDSTIKGVSDLFTVNGTLNFVDSKDNASLTFDFSKYLKNAMQVYVSDGTGKVHFYKANVNINTGDYYRVENNALFVIDKGNLNVNGLVYLDRVCLNTYQVENVDLGAYTSIGYRDLDGNECALNTYSGLPVGGEVIQIDENPVSGIYVNSDGKLLNMRVVYPEDVEGYRTTIYVKSGNDVKGYPNWGDRFDAIKVTFIDDATDTETKSYYTQSAKKLALLDEDEAYNYSYYIKDDLTEETQEVNENTVVDGDMTVYYTKTPKPKVQVTIDNVSKFVDCGMTLEQAGYTGSYIDTESGELVNSSEVIVTARNLESIKLSAQEKDGVIWYSISSNEDMVNFAKYVNMGATQINGLLTTDLTLGNEFPMIGKLETIQKEVSGYEYLLDFKLPTYAFVGMFDGQNHTITLNLDQNSQAVGFFGAASSNAVIKNVVIDGNVKGEGQYTAGLVGCIVTQPGGGVSIENCVNKAKVTGNYAAAGLVGAKVDPNMFHESYPNMELRIDNCANTGEVSASKKAAFLGHQDFSATTIKNCYNTDACALSNTSYDTIVNCYSISGKGSGGTELEEEAFESGEVTYLLNTNASSNIWYQTCGEGYPSLVGDPLTQSVYAGYEDCHSEERLYANSEFAHKTKGHGISGDIKYEDGKILMGCIYCDEKISATIVIPEEAYASGTQAVSAECDAEWERSGYPEIAILYSDSEDGDYSETRPTEAGTWYLKVSVGDKELLIPETFTIAEDPEIKIDPEEKPNPAEEEKPNPTEEEKPNPAEEEKPNPAEEEKPNPTEKEKRDSNKKETQISKKQVKANEIAINAKLKLAVGSKVNVSWGKVTGADGYDVYMSYYTKGKLPVVKTIKSAKTTSATIKKLKNKKIDQSKIVKCKVVAYKLENGKKITLAESIEAYAVGSKYKKATDAKSVKLSKNQYTLSKGKSETIKATTVKRSSKRKVLSKSYVAEFRYASSNEAVAKVSTTGKITAKGKGSCYVYVYAANGNAKKVKVTVK